MRYSVTPPWPERTAAARCRELFPVSEFVLSVWGRPLGAQVGACWMQPKFKGPIYLELAKHSAMGAALGFSLALVLLILDAQRVFEMIANSSAPGLTMLVFLGTFTLSFTIGATLTGWIFMTHES
jgi:hypothetical protein